MRKPSFVRNCGHLEPLPSLACFLGVLLIASQLLVWISIPINPAATDVIRHSRAVSLALNLLPFAGIAFLWFIAVMRSRLGDLEDHFFATVFMGSGYRQTGKLQLS